MRWLAWIESEILREVKPIKTASAFRKCLRGYFRIAKEHTNNAEVILLMLQISIPVCP